MFVVQYKAAIEKCIEQLPAKEVLSLQFQIDHTLTIEQKFDVICTFTPFGGSGNVIKETDYRVNKEYCQENLIEVLDSFVLDEILTSLSQIFKDQATKVKMIIVAEKLQTGFDAPTLAIMYIDKKMKDAALVQTLGRLSRIAKVLP